MKLLAEIKNHIGTMSRGVKASMAFFLASLIEKGIAYLTTPFYTRMMTTAEYGKAAVYFTWNEVIGIIAMFCLYNGVFNTGMVDYPDKRNEYAVSMVGLSNVITVITGIVFFMVYPFVGSYIGVDPILLVTMFIIFLVRPAYLFWIGKQRYEMKYKWSVTWSLLIAFATPIITIGLILLLPNNRYLARVIGNQIPLFIAGTIFYIYWIKKNNGKITTKYWKAAFLFNLPMIPHYLSSLLLNSSDKLMISELVNDAAAGKYSVAYSVAALVSIVWSAINASLVPFTYENCKKKDYQKISNVTIPILMAFAAICIMIIMFAPEVLRVMATDEYLEAIYIIPPIVGGVFFQVQYFMYANILFYYKKPVYVSIASISSTLLNIVLNYVLIQWFGYFAAGYTTLVCYVVQAVIDFFAMKKVVGNGIYNMKQIIILSLGVIIVSILCTFIYDYPLIRYGILEIIMLVFILMRKRLMKLFRSMK